MYRGGDVNILQVGKYYYPNLGGIERVVTDLSEGLVALDHDVDVLASVDKGRGEQTTINGVSVSKVGSVGQALSVPISPAFPYRLRQHTENKDIVHYHIPNPLAVCSHWFANQPNRGAVVTYHSDIVRQSRSFRAYRPVLKKFLASVDKILVTSPRLPQNSDVLNEFEDKCHVVPIGINIDEYGSYDGKNYGFTSDDRPVILFVGRLVYYKGIEYLIEAIREIEAHLLLVGDGELRDSLEKRVDRYGLNDKVTFLGHVSEECLHFCFDEADLFVLPSVKRSEAFGIVQLEAMAYGTPVINTDLPSGVPWVSQHGDTGLTVQPGDSGALAEAILELLDDDELREQYGKRARERVRDKFSVSRMVDRTIDEYQTL